MADMKDRETAFESKFALDEELRFKATARRNKLLGLWVAGINGKTGDAAAAYATEVVMADFEEAGDEDVFRKLRGDLDGSVTDTQIRTAMVEQMAVAIDQIQKG